MSCYEWERGEIKLPPLEFRRIRDLIAIHHNDMEMERYVLSQRFFSETTPAMRKSWATKTAWFMGRDMRPDSWGYSELLEQCPQVAEWRKRAPLGNPDEPDQIEIERYDGGTKTYKRLRKKDLHMVKGASFVIRQGDYTMAFENNTIEWEVGDGNHAREYAHRMTLARILFSELAAVKWTPRTGGVIIGNDEYSRDSWEIGGGGNYITMVFGPQGEREQKQHRGF